MTSTALKQLRVDSGVKRSQICRWAQINYDTLYKWEVGSRQPPHWVFIIYQTYIEKYRKVESS